VDRVMQIGVTSHCEKQEQKKTEIFRIRTGIETGYNFIEFKFEYYGRAMMMMMMILMILYSRLA